MLKNQTNYCAVVVVCIVVLNIVVAIIVFVVGHAKRCFASATQAPKGGGS